MGKVELQHEDFPRFDAERLRTRWWLVAILLGLALAGFASPLYGLREDTTFVILLCATVPLFLAGWVGSTLTWRTAARCEVRVAPALLVIDGVEIPRASIAQGYAFELHGRTLILLERRGVRRDVVLAVLDERLASEFLRALRLRPEHATLTVRASAPLANAGHFMWGFVTLALPLAAFIAPLPYDWYEGLLLFSTPVTVVCLFIGLWPAKVVVGREALLVRWVGMKWVYPFERILSVRQHRQSLGEGNALHGVLLSVYGKGERTLITGHNRFGGEEQAAILAARVVDTLSVFRARNPTESPLLSADDL